MFWEKFQYLSEIKGIKPHAVLKELEISSGSANLFYVEFFDFCIEFIVF